MAKGFPETTVPMPLFVVKGARAAPLEPRFGAEVLWGLKGKSQGIKKNEKSFKNPLTVE